MQAERCWDFDWPRSPKLCRASAGCLEAEHPHRAWALVPAAPFPGCTHSLFISSTALTLHLWWKTVGQFKMVTLLNAMS